MANVPEMGGSKGVRSRRAALALLAGAAIPGSVRALAAEPKRSVDLALILATDVSLSIDEGETSLQRLGYIAAFRDKRVSAAIHNGPIGRIAITYVEWSSPYHQSVRIPWRLLSDAKTCTTFADDLQKMPVEQGTTTSISGAIDFSVKLLRAIDYEPTRKVIDVSGDGYSDVGRPIITARDEAVKEGITINGLPVMNEDPKKNAAPPDLDTYYRDNVIGGPGSFYVVARNLKGFSESVLKKLLLEIAGDPAEIARHAG
jgi:hypothetical protein